jgi:hypothetical protein
MIESKIVYDLKFQKIPEKCPNVADRYYRTIQEYSIQTAKIAKNYCSKKVIIVSQTTQA